MRMVIILGILALVLLVGCGPTTPEGYLKEMKGTGVLTTDKDYGALLDFMKTMDGFEITGKYLLSPEDVVNGSTYLDGKMMNYENYLPYLQELDLNEYTAIVEYKRGNDIVYSVVDLKEGESLKLIMQKYANLNVNLNAGEPR